MFVLFKILPAGGRNQPNHKGSSKSQISPTRKTLRGNHRNSDMSATQNATVANPVSVFIHQAWDRTCRGQTGPDRQLYRGFLSGTTVEVALYKSSICFTWNQWLPKMNTDPFMKTTLTMNHMELSINSIMTLIHQITTDQTSTPFKWSQDWPAQLSGIDDCIRGCHHLSWPMTAALFYCSHLQYNEPSQDPGTENKSVKSAF